MLHTKTTNITVLILCFVAVGLIDCQNNTISDTDTIKQTCERLESCEPEAYTENVNSQEECKTSIEQNLDSYEGIFGERCIETTLALLQCANKVECSESVYQNCTEENTQFYRVCGEYIYQTWWIP